MASLVVCFFHVSTAPALHRLSLCGLDVDIASFGGSERLRGTMPLLSDAACCCAVSCWSSRRNSRGRRRRRDEWTVWGPSPVGGVKFEYRFILCTPLLPDPSPPPPPTFSLPCNVSNISMDTDTWLYMVVCYNNEVGDLYV